MDSPIHEAMADDELNVKRMNVRPAGKQPLMKDGFYFRDGEKVQTSLSSALYLIILSTQGPF